MFKSQRKFKYSENTTRNSVPHVFLSHVNLLSDEYMVQGHLWAVEIPREIWQKLRYYLMWRSVMWWLENDVSENVLPPSSGSKCMVILYCAQQPTKPQLQTHLMILQNTKFHHRHNKITPLGPNVCHLNPIKVSGHLCINDILLPWGFRIKILRTFIISPVRVIVKFILIPWNCPLS